MLNEIVEIATQRGLSEKYAQVLVKIAKKHDIEKEVYSVIISHGYNALIESAQSLKKDPTLFYYDKKKLKTGKHKLNTYGFLSVSYSLASPIRILSFIIEDAKKRKKEISETIELYESCKEDMKGIYDYDDDGWEEDLKCALFDIERYFNPKNARFSLVYDAVKQDFRGAKIPDELTDRVYAKLKEIGESQSYGYRPFGNDERIFMALYVYFSSQKGQQVMSEYTKNKTDAISEKIVNDINNNKDLLRRLDSFECDFFNPKEMIHIIESHVYFVKKNGCYEERELPKLDEIKF